VDVRETAAVGVADEEGVPGIVAVGTPLDGARGSKVGKLLPTVAVEPEEQVCDEVPDLNGGELNPTRQRSQNLRDLWEEVQNDVVAFTLVRDRMVEPRRDPGVRHQLVVWVLPVLVVGLPNRLNRHPLARQRDTLDLSDSEVLAPVGLDHVLGVLILLDRWDEEQAETVLDQAPALGTVQHRRLGDLHVETQERVHDRLHPAVQILAPGLGHQVGRTEGEETVGGGCLLRDLCLVMVDECVEVCKKAITIDKLTQAVEDTEMPKQSRKSITTGLVDLVDQLLHPRRNRESHLCLQP